MRDVRSVTCWNAAASPIVAGRSFDRPACMHVLFHGTVKTVHRVCPPRKHDLTERTGLVEMNDYSSTSVTEVSWSKRLGRT